MQYRVDIFIISFSILLNYFTLCLTIVTNINANICLFSFYINYVSKQQNKKKMVELTKVLKNNKLQW